MNILVACEESQEVCKELRKRGHRAFSCDIQDCSGGHPEWHIKSDVTKLVNGNCEFDLQNGTKDRQTDRQTDGICLLLFLPVHISPFLEQGISSRRERTADSVRA